MKSHNAAFPFITQSTLFSVEQNQNHYELLATPYFHPSSSADILLSSSASPTAMIFPTASTVVIGKGSVPKKATGNRNLRALVRDKIPEYVNAASKMVKSSIVTDIYFAIQEACIKEGSSTPFVRYDRKGYQGSSESIAREKITSTFRDSLHDKYKSSTKSKVARRRLAKKKKAETKLENSVMTLQQHGMLEKNFLPIHQQSNVECSSASPALIQSSCPPQQGKPQQLQQPQQQQQTFANIETTNNCFKKLYNNLFTSNQLPERSSNIGPFCPVPLIEFDRSFHIDIEPTPIPELDVSSTSSSSSCSCSYRPCSHSADTFRNHIDHGAVMGHNDYP